MNPRKYEIESATALTRMSVSFRDGELLRTAGVWVDYASRKIEFDEELPGIDYGELEEEILARLMPEAVEKPTLPPEVLQRIAEVRAGKYGAEMP